MSHVHDVVVIGAGPAGSTAATRLALLGHDVALIARNAEPVRRVGESLPPTIAPILEAIGVRDRIDGAGFLRPDHAVVMWTREPTEPWAWPARGYSVDRAVFDALLRDAASDAGAKVFAPVCANRPKHENGLWRVPGEGCPDVRGHLLVDATGKGGILPGAREGVAVRTIALHAYGMADGVMDDAPWIEALESAWTWAAPMGAGAWSAAVFVDAPRAARVGDRLSLFNHFASQARAPVWHRAQFGPIRAWDATPARRLDPFGEDWVAIGEAALAVDPISSQGVPIAMTSALHAAAAMHTMLAYPTRKVLAERFVRERHQETWERTSDEAARAYRTQNRHQHESWARRAALAPARPALPAISTRAPRTLEHADFPFMLAPDCCVSEVPALVGDCIDLATALTHPAFDRPIAFVGDIPLAPLARALARPTTYAAAMQSVTQEIRLSSAQAALRWLLDKGLVVAAIPSEPT